MLVYYFRNPEQLSAERLTELVASLPPQQQEIIARTKNHRQQCEQTIAYIMLCHALKTHRHSIASAWNKVIPFHDKLLTSRYVRRNPPLWAFGEHGKPHITNYEGIHFNISHCKEAVAIGISDREVGIDIEGRRHYSDTLLQRAFCDEEQAAIKASDDPEKEFASLWTRKEAWFKWTGTGILLEHLKTTESDAASAGCAITTIPIVGSPDFWLSIAQ